MMKGSCMREQRDNGGMSGPEPSRKASEIRSMHAETEMGRVSRAKKNRAKVIGEQLRRGYQEVVDAGVPDEFLRLLEEADRNDKAGGDKR
jgi:hypothetical protein